MMEIKALLIVITTIAGPHYNFRPLVPTQTITPFPSMELCSRMSANVAAAFNARQGGVSGYNVISICVHAE